MARLMFCACIFVLFAPRAGAEEFQVSLKYVTWETSRKDQGFSVPANARTVAALDVQVESGKMTRVKAQIGDRALEMRVSVHRSAGEEVGVHLFASYTERTDVGIDSREVSSTADLKIGKCRELLGLPGEYDQTGKVLRDAAFILRVSKPERGH